MMWWSGGDSAWPGLLFAIVCMVTMVWLMSHGSHASYGSHGSHIEEPDGLAGVDLGRHGPVPKRADRLYAGRSEEPPNGFQRVRGKGGRS